MDVPPEIVGPYADMCTIHPNAEKRYEFLMANISYMIIEGHMQNPLWELYTKMLIITYNELSPATKRKMKKRFGNGKKVW